MFPVWAFGEGMSLIMPIRGQTIVSAPRGGTYSNLSDFVPFRRVSLTPSWSDGNVLACLDRLALLLKYARLLFMTYNQ